MSRPRVAYYLDGERASGTLRMVKDSAHGHLYYALAGQPVRFCRVVYERAPGARRSVVHLRSLTP